MFAPILALAVLSVTAWVSAISDDSGQDDEPIVLLPELSAIVEMRADVYNSRRGLPDSFNFVVPKEHYGEVLAFFQPSKKRAYGSDPPTEEGRVTIKAKGYLTRTILFYQRAKNTTLLFSYKATLYERDGERIISGITLEELIRRMICEAESQKKTK